jgi:hypothetical protein
MAISFLATAAAAATPCEHWSAETIDQTKPTLLIFPRRALARCPVNWPLVSFLSCSLISFLALAPAMATRRRGRPALLLLGFVVFLLKGGALSRADDTVATGRPLSGGQSLVSKRGKFRLGFFQPGTSSSPELGTADLFGAESVLS